MKRIHSYMITAVAAMSLFAGCIPPANQTNGAGGANPGAQGPFGSATTLVFLGGMILVFWLFFIRPQAKRAKNQKKFIEDLQKGSRIVTIAGIHGVINKVNEDGTLTIETSPGSYLKIEKSAISMDWTAALNKTGAAEKK